MLARGLEYAPLCPFHSSRVSKAGRKALGHARHWAACERHEVTASNWPTPGQSRKKTRHVICTVYTSDVTETDIIFGRGTIPEPSTSHIGQGVALDAPATVLVYI
jgi:hypothetical protein